MPLFFKESLGEGGAGCLALFPYWIRGYLLGLMMDMTAGTKHSCCGGCARVEAYVGFEGCEV